MRVRISFEVNVDPAAWAKEYGTPIREVPADVKSHAKATVMGHFESIGLLL
ncbi:hypothetical protein SEA_RANDO14_71 [Mycobacterium phage Rando14]|uniref:Uncharacterized protein n=1 Tax=Mycobacterium phage Rando14 TaxID=2301556 RepID=A0A385D5C8_9CAUD|nr:hypothetical protein I5G75_gp25 [Mycobacterium phage Rando14]AXQ53091.1 hypothetical protein SEA_RANDO14_71 [Mycobacterium phage Rando14]